jgi:hypothetical protein
MKWEKYLYHVERHEREFVGFFKFETGELFPGPHYQKFQVSLTRPMNEGEAISLLNAKAEKLLQGLNEQAEYEQKEFEKYFEKADAI